MIANRKWSEYVKLVVKLHKLKSSIPSIEGVYCSKCNVCVYLTVDWVNRFNFSTVSHETRFHLLCILGNFGVLMQFSRGRLDNPFVNLSLAELLQLILTKAEKREREKVKRLGKVYLSKHQKSTEIHILSRGFRIKRGSQRTAWLKSINVMYSSHASLSCC